MERGKPGGISNSPEPPPTFCGANLKKITESLKKITGSLKKITGSLKKITGNLKKITGNFNKSTGSFNKSTGNFNKMGIRLKKAYEKGSLDGLPVSTK